MDEIDSLLLLSGNDIPFVELGLSIHNPTLKEIALMGEENFFTGYQMLCVSKNLLTVEDKINLDDITNFDILIAILKERNAVMQKNKYCVEMLLAILFQDCEIAFKDKEISLTYKEEVHTLNSSNFDNFQTILKKMFNTGDESDSSNPNPAGQYSKKIAEKLRKRHQKLAELKPNDQPSGVLNRYISVLAIGLSLSINEVMNFTMYQLFDQIQRYELKIGYDIHIQAKMAGASDLKDPEDWMKDIHPKN